MSRIRYIKPTIGTDEDLAQVSIAARYLFAMLPTLCDREGRLEDKPKLIKLSTFPWDEVDVDKLLNELSPRFLVRYKVGERAFLQVLGFVKHQRPHPGEEKSKIPPFQRGKIKLHGKKLNLIAHNVDSPLKGDGDSDSKEGLGKGTRIAASPPGAVVSKPKTGIQKVMRGYKEAKGIHSDDAEWDEKHFKRFARPAADLLKVFDGNAEAAIVYTLKKGRELDEKGMTSWGLEAVARAAATDPLVRNLTGGNDGPENSEVGAVGVDGERRYHDTASSREIVGDALKQLESFGVPEEAIGIVADGAEYREFDRED